MSMIRTEHLAKSFGELVVLKDINLTVESGEVVVIIGPSEPVNLPFCVP